MLRPQDTATRERKNLDGIWSFRLDGEAGTAVTSGPRYVRHVPREQELKHWRRLRKVLAR